MSLHGLGQLLPPIDSFVILSQMPLIERGLKNVVIYNLRKIFHHESMKTLYMLGILYYSKAKLRTISKEF